MRVMVFDIGGTDVKYALMDERGHALSSGSVPTPRTSLDELVSLVSDTFHAQADGPSGIALSLPGLVDVNGGICITGGSLAYNYGQPLGPMISKACGVPVTVENDGKCAALAELRSGALRGVTNGCTLVFGTSLGCGLVIDGRVCHGPHFSAGQLSQVALDLDHWEADSSYASQRCGVPYLTYMIRKATGLSEEEVPNGRAAFDVVATGNPRARQALDDFCMLVGKMIHNLAVTLDLERVAIGGGVSSQDVLVEGIAQATVRAHETLPVGVRQESTLPQVVRCAYGSEANELGALYTYLDALDKERQ